MEDVFERFVNGQFCDTSTAQLFTKYCDSLLISTGNGDNMHDSDVDIEVGKFVKLFTYFTENDVLLEPPDFV